MSLRKNMIWPDRLFRFVVGVALLSYAFAGGPWWAYAGVVPLLTAAFSYCPFYALLS